MAEQAVTAAEAGHFEAAVKLFSAAIRSDEHNAALHEQQAQCYMELRQYDAAAKAAERATALKPAVSCARQSCACHACDSLAKLPSIMACAVLVMATSNCQNMCEWIQYQCAV